MDRARLPDFPVSTVAVQRSESWRREAVLTMQIQEAARANRKFFAVGGLRAGAVGLLNELPYIAIIVLGLVGICWTSISGTPVTAYWVILTPICAFVCSAVGWRRDAGTGERVAMRNPNRQMGGGPGRDVSHYHQRHEQIAQQRR